MPLARPASPRFPLLALLLCALLALVALETAAASPEGEAAARKSAIKGLGKKMRKLARNPRVLKKLDEVNEILDGLEILGGPEAANEALGGAPIDVPEIRDRVFAFAEKEHDPILVKPLAALLDRKNKLYRDDRDLLVRAAHALSVVADPRGMECLTELIRSDVDAEVVAAAADALATFGSAPLALRKAAVKRMVDLYETTWNLAKTVNPELKIQKKIFEQRYKVYGRSLQAALQALTGQQLTRPQEWRRWWNDYKKARDWSKATPRERTR